ncbi:MAG: hypothetical protein Q4B70_10055 [Lachnospiraceae bacterium]|nr:hypothetical protein [Lachnospiraceae bacterium]
MEKYDRICMIMAAGAERSFGLQENKRVDIKTLDVDMASVISKNSKENLRAFMRRLGLLTEDGWDKDMLAMNLKETIMDHPEYILYVYNRETLAFLMYLWEQDGIEAGQLEWAYIGQLQLLGFLDYSMETREKESGSIYLIQEAVDSFYFYLKSHRAMMDMGKYDIWERLIRGMMSFYGILSFNRLYFYFCKNIREPVDDEQLHCFLAGRISLWSFGSFVMEKHSHVEYYEIFDTTDPEHILEQCEEEHDFDYHCPEYDELLYVADNNGFGQWDGIGELADILMEDLEIEYYQTVVIIKSCILMVQNGEDCERIMTNILKWCPKGEPYKEPFLEAVKNLYRSVPVYGLKGWNRKEISDMHKNKNLFTVLEGGKYSKGKGKKKNP